MDKKITDRAINRWILKFLLGPASLLTLLAFALGYGWPDALVTVQPIAQRLGLNHLVGQRTVGTEFDSAAYLYWLTFWLTLPFNLFWLHRAGLTENLTETLRVVALRNLNFGRWNPQKFTLIRGYLLHFISVAMFISLVMVQAVMAAEPSYCKGCETRSLLGFFVINWGGVNMLMVASYVSLLNLVSWKSVRLTFEAGNE